MLKGEYHADDQIDVPDVDANFQRHRVKVNGPSVGFEARLSFLPALLGQTSMMSVNRGMFERPLLIQAGEVRLSPAIDKHQDFPNIGKRGGRQHDLSRTGFIIPGDQEDFRFDVALTGNGHHRVVFPR